MRFKIAAATLGLIIGVLGRHLLTHGIVATFKS
jgi:hypothetical protein